MEQSPEIREPKPEPKLEDIGTREEHLRDYLESLHVSRSCVNVECIHKWTKNG